MRTPRQRHGWDAPLLLPGDSQYMTARGQDLEMIAPLQERHGERRARRRQVLAVVEKQQQAFRLQFFTQAVKDRASGVLGYPHRGCHVMRHQRRVHQRAEIDPPDTIRVAFQHRRRDLEG